MIPIALQITDALGCPPHQVREWVQVTETTWEAWRESRTPIPLGALLMIGQMATMLVEGRKRFMQSPDADRKVKAKMGVTQYRPDWKAVWAHDLRLIGQMILQLDDEIDKYPRETIQEAQQESAETMRQVARSMKLQPKGTASVSITVEAKRWKRRWH